MMLVDSHCHLDFPDFAEDVQGVIDRALAAGVGRMLTISTHLTRARQVVDVAERFAPVYCTVGVHPHEAGTEPAATIEALCAWAAHPKVAGFGETGLDYYYDKSPRERQRDSFRLHLEAAHLAGLPVVIHSRDGEDDLLEIMESVMAKTPFTGVVHCFSGTPQLAARALALGLYLSFSGILTFRNAESLRDIARTVPRDRVLVETDAPFLAPVPHRGKRNEPALVAHTARLLGELMGLGQDDLAAVTTANFNRLFPKAKVS